MFRADSAQILSYGIDHGHSHAQQAVQEAESAIKTFYDKDGQFAKLLALAKRTLVLIENQDAVMKEDEELSDIEEEDEDEQQAEEVKEVEVKEIPPEIAGQRSGRRSTYPVTLDHDEFGIGEWDFQAVKNRKPSTP